jgi:citrate-Mg2+:H+ or citrate-Ca2+:H+ symporter, CitMHS family
MLAFLGFSMVVVFMYLIMTHRMSALIALMVIPILFGLIGGFGTSMGDMMLEGLKSVAPTGVMLIFAILYFGIMIDAGLFDPLIGAILKVVKGDPLKIVIGTAVLAILVALDGDGTTTYIITVSAMLPLYVRLGMNPLILSSVAMLAFGIMNMMPWGGPTARAISALHLDATEVFPPLIPIMAAGLIWVCFSAYLFGKKERKRLGIVHINHAHIPMETAAALEEQTDIKQPRLLWFNFLLTAALLVGLIRGIMPLPILFMIAFAVAAMVNYPSLDEQKKRISAHAGNVLMVVSLVFASGIFTGILSGTKMVDAMAASLVSIIPESLGPYFSIITAITSLPFTYFMANDPYYFGVLPIIAKTAAAYSVDPVAIARASVLGQPIHAMSPLMASAYLLVGMVGVEFGEHQRFILKWALGTSAVMIMSAVLLGAI